MVVWIVFFVFVTTVSSVNLGNSMLLYPLVIVFLVAALIVFLCNVWARLYYNNFLYELREEGFVKSSGVIWKKYVTIPYERIQNVDIYRGPVARILGLSDLHVQTAGSSAVYSRYGSSGQNAEGRLPGLSSSDAEAVRDELIRRARTGKAGL